MTRDRMYLETMQQIFASTSKVLMDTKQTGNMIYLPLEKMISQGESVANKPATAAVAPNSAQVQGEQIPTVEMRYGKDSRSRDVRDSRDRETR